ncbi:hypothetical protein [Singulisphaera acidiphila]|uniref:Carboxypeptidase regulatory-like domain-containing protein n=1 Tax=Singulisphaera acidiphila (strain ATCC BAA-1392 / DSM 18658 / VKM B-2454 / MOB10) TaxID=886293 RepID=L0D8M6_SINAD|nr:hypothetical protein [Singulisphaera acidiphila]AGA24981.1 hypothetical protein Sinac_0557 [Singulisphaera acidiphila DSM 18658]
MRTETKRQSGLVGAKLVRGVALAVALVMVGCADEGPARQPVSGIITLDGKPLPSGSVTFAPLDGATAATAEVRDGTYQIARSVGPAPGRYQVEINAVKPTGKRIKHPDLPTETIDEVRNVIPAHYNVRTQLAIVVTSDGDNAFPFDLTTSRRVASRTRGR